MNIKRIKEIQNIANDFLKNFQYSEEASPSEDNKCIQSYNKIIKKSYSSIFPKSKNISFNIRKSISNYNITNGKHKLKPLPSKSEDKFNVHKTLIPWIPPKYVGNYFESFKRLTDHYDMSNWEKVINNHSFNFYKLQHRIHLCSRSYQKEKLLPLKKDFICRKLWNYELNKFPNTRTSPTEAIKNLAPSGKKLIKVFINENDKREQKSKNDEEKLYIYKHSKPPIQYNSWKFSNHVIEEFSRPKADEVHGFREKIKTKYQYTAHPFRRPKEEGDYFDKHIGIL